MASRKSSSRSDGHTPVENQPAEATETPLKRKVSPPPEQGENPRRTPVTEEGTEAVKGRSSTRSASAGSMAEAYTAPVSENLRDIGEASFGPPPPSAESVIGVDDRVQITNTSVYPWRVHSSLLITAADNSTWIGTGWFISPRTLVTAGHCVYIKNSGVPGRDGWVRSMQVMPGRNGSNLPYGSVTSTQFRTVTGWTNNGDENFDYGVIILPTPMGSTVGWFGYGVYTDSDLTATMGNISGYPGDKPSGTQWYHARRIISVNNRKVFYDIDTAGGQSGSAVYRIINNAIYGVAIHAYGTGTGRPNNSGTRINQEVFNNLTSWKV